jgi:iron complex transport system substrate-binding protein
MKKTILSVIVGLSTIVMVLMSFGLVACTQGATVPSAGAATAPAGEDAGDGTVTVTDGTGARVTVKVNPKRVAIYDIAILDILDAAGFDRTGIEVLGIPKTESSLPDYLAAYRDNDECVNVGSLFTADFDVLDLLQPDLIVGGSRLGAKDEDGETVAEVNRRYPDAAYLNFDIDMFAEGMAYEKGLERNLGILAQIFPDLKDELEAGTRELSQGFAEVRARSGDAETLFLMIGPGYITFYGPDGRFSMAHREFGFKPADSTTREESNHGAEVNAEYVKATNPKVILLLDRNASFGEASSVEEFMANPLIRETDAYNDGHIYTLDNAAWYLNPGGLTSTRLMIADLRHYTDTVK